MDIVGIYFVVFPAMAVINCLYINLYKIKGIMKTYIKNTFWNFAFINYSKYYFCICSWRVYWCCYCDYNNILYLVLIGFKQFEFLRITVKDVTYLIAYTIGFFVITKAFNDYLGFLYILPLLQCL